MEERRHDMLYTWALNNPLKQILFTNNYTYNSNSKSEKNQFFVPTVKEYMDLSKGIWNVSLDTYVIKNLDYAVDTVLDISTNLVSGIKFDKLRNTHESSNACLGKIFLYVSPNMHFSGPFEKKWFTVQSGRDFANFEFYVKQNPLATKETSINFDFEISFLFQRIK